MKFFKKSYTYAACFGLLLTSSFSYSMLKTFVLSDAIQTVKATTTDTKAAKKAAASATTTDTSYSDDNIQVSLTEKTIENTQVYIADITVSSSDYLKTAFAQNTYGTNVTAKTSVTAANNSAILAVNGDYYGANSTGYVIRNGVVYRDTVREDSSNGDLAIYKDGSFKIIYEDEISADQLVKDGVVNLLAFGPSLVENGEITVDTNSEVGQSMASNPRTAIGIIDENHYIIVVSDGRTSESEGLSLYQLAEVMKSYGVKTAYNLDGGGSSTLYFNGQVINKPTTNGTIQKGRWVTLSTSVTNPIKQRLKKTILWYTLISAFFFVGSRIYEHFSFGETSAFMHYLFLIPLIGGALLVLLQLMVKGFSRLSLNLWNSGVATLTVGALYRGIVNLSGRSTTMDQPYFYLGVAFLALALISLFFVRSVWVEKTA